MAGDQYIYYPPPEPHQRPPSATLPGSVGDNPPWRGGPIAAAVLALLVGSWPGPNEPTPPQAQLRQVVHFPPTHPRPFRLDLVFVGGVYRPEAYAVPSQWPSAESQPTQMDEPPPIPPEVDLPPPRPIRLEMVFAGGVFRSLAYPVPTQWPSGQTPTVPVDAPPFRRDYVPEAVLGAWVVDWPAQSARLSTPPSGAPSTPSYVPPARAGTLARVLAGWEETAAIDLPLGAAPQPAAGDRPTPRVPLPPAIHRQWTVDWSAQRGPQHYQGLSGGQPPRRADRQPPTIGDQWRARLAEWAAQSAGSDAEWNLPPLPPGDAPPPRDAPTLRTVQLAIVHAWSAVLERWDAQTQSDAAAWNVPPAAPGDQPPTRLQGLAAAGIAQSWVPADWPRQLPAIVAQGAPRRPGQFVARLSSLVTFRGRTEPLEPILVRTVSMNLVAGMDLDARIQGYVAGDDLTLTYVVEDVPAGDTISKAWLTVKRRVIDTDLQAKLQKAVTPADLPGTGQVTDVGSGGTGGLRFDLTAADTLSLGTTSWRYDVQVLTAAGYKYTVENGILGPLVGEVTKATS